MSFVVILGVSRTSFETSVEVGNYPRTEFVRLVLFRPISALIPAYMPIRKVNVGVERASSAYRIGIGPDLIGSCGKIAQNSLPHGAGKAVLVSNAKVFGLYGQAVAESLKSTGFEVSVCLIGDGERYKNIKTLHSILDHCGENKISRTDSVIALGGGVVGDIAGFAASIYLRGISFIQMPTTLLSMIDSSVGGKTGINTRFGKNLTGAFYQPSAVIVDTRTLATLPKREVTAGLCEAVKQGAIGGRGLFDIMGKFLDSYSPTSFSNRSGDKAFESELGSVLAAQIGFKAEIVAGDERESPTKTSARSRKILNFGHTFAHALEKVTNYRYLKHGEAVGWGIIFAAELSKNVGLLSADKVKLLNDVVRRTGKLPKIGHIELETIFAAFGNDKKVINRSLQWILLKDIGKPVVVPQAEIPESAIFSAFYETVKN